MTTVTPTSARDTAIVTVGAAPLSPADVVAVARHGAHVVLSP
ncbi:MAG: hypothetical protein K0R99_4088, partial [Microbacterium sp.]|nr:hypothetical protein [Microbacterium sp.]